jgi:magnesium transporter
MDATDISREPWKEIEDALDRGDTQQIRTIIESRSNAELTQAVGRLHYQARQRLALSLPPRDMVKFLHKADPLVSAPLLALMKPENAALAVAGVREDIRQSVLKNLPDGDSRIIMASLSPAERKAIQRRLSYLTNSAGALMTSHFVSHSIDATVGDVIDKLRKNAEEYADYEVQYVYVLGENEKLEGVLRLRDLLFKDARNPVREAMIAEPAQCHPEASLEEMIAFFEERAFFAVPVVDGQSVMLGIVSRKIVLRAATVRANNTMMKLHGIIGGEEYRSMPLGTRSLRRLSWLTVNIFLNLLAAGVIVLFEDTLLRVISLAAFLPIISDMSGNAGNQAVAVSLRELTLRLIRPAEFGYVLLKESALGLINGLALGLLLGIMALIWKGNLWLGLVAGGALAINTIVAVCAGGILPLALRRLKVDPALVASPVLTTVTDVSGFLFTLGFATLALDWIA